MTSESPQTPDREASGPREGGPAIGAPRPPFRPGGPRRDGPGGPRGFGPPGARRPRRKVCVFCLEKVKRIDYKDKPRLQRFLSDRAKIDPRRKSGNCAKHQRMLTTALKRARYMALLPYTADHVRAMMSPRDRAIAGGPPPARPDRGPRTFIPRPAPEGAIAPRPASAAPATPATPPAETPKAD